MKLALCGFVLRRVGSSLRDLLWSHALATMTMAVALFVFGAFLLLQVNLQQLHRGWAEEVRLTAYLKNGLSPAEVESLRQRVAALSQVAAVQFTSTEQAWRDFHRALGAQSGLLDGLPRDLLPASFEIAPKPDRRDEDSVAELAAQLQKEPGVAGVEYPKEWVERLSSIIVVVEWAKWVFAAVMIMAILTVVGSTVKLALSARRDEVEIMQLVGASEELIQAPFVIEGMIQGLIGAALAIAGLWGGFVLVRGEMPTLAALLAPQSAPQFLDGWSIVLLIAIGVLLGAAASLGALKRLVQTWQASAA